MSLHNTSCPNQTEEDLAVLPGPEPGTAMCVRVESGDGQYVRLEHLAFSADLGWYTQKSFCVPAGMLRDLVTQLNKADCLMRPAQRDGREPRTLAFPGPAMSDDDNAVLARLEA